MMPIPPPNIAMRVDIYGRRFHSVRLLVPVPSRTAVFKAFELIEQINKIEIVTNVRGDEFVRPVNGVNLTLMPEDTITFTLDGSRADRVFEELRK